jgi:hypothetical protein
MNKKMEWSSEAERELQKLSPELQAAIIPLVEERAEEQGEAFVAQWCALRIIEELLSAGLASRMPEA